jgi:hypothetical protein
MREDERLRSEVVDLEKNCPVSRADPFYMHFHLLMNLIIFSVPQQRKW